MAMEPYVIVLAKNSQEGATYVRRAKLQRGRWRIASSAGSIRGLRRAHVHMLDSFHERADRHAILAELRHAKCEWFDVQMPPREDRVVDQGDGFGQQVTIDDLLRDRRELHLVEGPGALMRELGPDLEAIGTLETIPEANGEDAWENEGGNGSTRNSGNGDIPSSAESEGFQEEDEPDPMSVDDDDQAADAAEDETPKRRRSKCKTCQMLHFKDEACPVQTPSMFD